MQSTPDYPFTVRGGGAENAEDAELPKLCKFGIFCAPPPNTQEKNIIKNKAKPEMTEAPPKYELRLTPEKHLELLSQISSGLLASGHFTREHDEDDLHGESQLVRCVQRVEKGKDGKTTDHYSVAVTTAAAAVLFSLRRDVVESVNDWDPEDFILP